MFVCKVQVVKRSRQTIEREMKTISGKGHYIWNSPLVCLLHALCIS